MMPTVGYALLLVTLVSIVLSSLNSLLNAGATVLTQDLIRQFTHLPDRVALRTGRGCTILIAGIAAAAAMFVPSVIEGLLFCYSIWAPAILPALILGLWLPRPRPWAGTLSMMVGTLVAVAFKFPFFDRTGIPPILPALACSLLAYAVGHWAQGIHERAQAWT
jgi:SSS family solute:Na+ symporter